MGLYVLVSTLSSFGMLPAKFNGVAEEICIHDVNHSRRKGSLKIVLSQASRQFHHIGDVKGGGGGRGRRCRLSR